MFHKIITADVREITRDNINKPVGEIIAKINKIRPPRHNWPC